MSLASRLSLSIAFIIGGSRVALAHPGHAHTVVAAESPWHYWLQPEHALITGVMLSAAAAMLLLSFKRWRAEMQAKQMTALPVSRAPFSRTTGGRSSR